MAAPTKTPAKSKPPVAKNGGPPPQRVIDLASARAARLEAQGQPVVLKWDEKTSFTLPVEMPAEFAILGEERDIRGAIAALIGDQFEEFLALRPSMDDLMELMKAAATVYGMEPGEFQASDGS
jgi:hypothetical protein